MVGMKTEAWEDDLAREIRDVAPEGAPLEFLSFAGQPFAITAPELVVPLLETLKATLGFDYLVDETAVDYPLRTERFDLIYVLYSFERNQRIRLKTSIADGYRPQTATTVYRTANWLEREIFDMFGIEFDGHPNLKRILMPEEWTGFPLRKDYSIVHQDQNWVQTHLGIESGQ